MKDYQIFLRLTGNGKTASYDLSSEGWTKLNDSNYVKNYTFGTDEEADQEYNKMRKILESKLAKGFQTSMLVSKISWH
jgi:hypothetical protein